MINFNILLAILLLSVGCMGGYYFDRMNWVFVLGLVSIVGLFLVIILRVYKENKFLKSDNRDHKHKFVSR